MSGSSSSRRSRTRTSGGCAIPLRTIWCTRSSAPARWIGLGIDALPASSSRTPYNSTPSAVADIAARIAPRADVVNVHCSTPRAVARFEERSRADPIHRHRVDALLPEVRQLQGDGGNRWISVAPPSRSTQRRVTTPAWPRSLGPSSRSARGPAERHRPLAPSGRLRSARGQFRGPREL